MTRPTQITAILQTVSSGHDIQNTAELETYMADLEAKQPDRPVHIALIMQAIGTQYSIEIVTALNAYISDLEARQQPIPLKEASSYDAKNPPVWSHQRAMMREQQRRERALRKLNDYR